MKPIKITDVDDHAEYVVYSDGNDEQIRDLLDALNSTDCLVAGVMK